MVQYRSQTALHILKHTTSIHRSVFSTSIYIDISIPIVLLIFFVTPAPNETFKMDGSYLSCRNYGFEFDSHGQPTGHFFVEDEDCIVCRRGGYPPSDEVLGRRQRDYASRLGELLLPRPAFTLPTQSTSSAGPDSLAPPYSPPISLARSSILRSSSNGFKTVRLCRHELLDDWEAEKILRRTGATEMHELSLASAPKTCRASWIQG
jgi:hypothetical protein